MRVEVPTLMDLEGMSLCPQAEYARTELLKAYGGPAREEFEAELANRAVLLTADHMPIALVGASRLDPEDGSVATAWGFFDTRASRHAKSLVFLLRALVGHARTVGILTLVADIECGRRSALKLARMIGFEEIGRRGHEVQLVARTGCGS